MSGCDGAHESRCSAHPALRRYATFWEHHADARCRSRVAQLVTDLLSDPPPPDWDATRSVVQTDVSVADLWHGGGMIGDSPCPVCDGSPRVLVAVAHPVMRRLIVELLEREHGCWEPFVVEHDLARDMRVLQPDLVVVDSANFPGCCCGEHGVYPCRQMVIVGREPDAACRAFAERQGAGGWVAREDVADELSAEMRKALGCTHGPCPPAVDRTAATRVRRSTRPESVVAPDAQQPAVHDHEMQRTTSGHRPTPLVAHEGTIT